MRQRAVRALAAALLTGYCASGTASPTHDPQALESAAQQGDPGAQAELAARYQHAEGVPRDLARANHLYCSAAKRGHAEAQYQLGWNYAYGRGEPRDDAVAVSLFRMAADQGHEYAARALRLFAALPAVQLPPCMMPDPPVAQAPPARDPSAHSGESASTAPRTALLNVPSDIERLVRRLAPQYAVDTQLVLAVISVESAFDPTAVSPKNAQGLMQLIPETAARFGVRKPLNPVENIKGGLAYLRWLLAFFEGDVRLVLAAYNAGERAVERYRGVPPYAETREYVRKISALYPKTSHPYEPTVVRPSPITPQRPGSK